MVEATRWLFGVLALVSLLLALPGALLAATVPLKVYGLVALLVLGLSVVVGFLLRRATFAGDLIDAAALFCLALAGPDAAVGFCFIFGSLWFRGLYGSGRRAVLRCAMYAVVVVGSIQVWPHVPGQIGPGQNPMTLFTVIPTMFLTLVVGRHLAGVLHAHEQTSLRDAVLATFSPQLLTASDATEIRTIAWRAMEGLCDVTPGLRVLKVTREGVTLHVDKATEGFVALPETIPVSLDPPTWNEPDGHAPLARLAELDAAAGEHCTWTFIPRPAVPDELGEEWTVVGFPGRTHTGALRSLAQLSNNVVLALRSSKVHRELTVLATVDTLTGLLNRRSFHSALSAAVATPRAQPTSVLFIDLDDFKYVNDSFGHAAGDVLLREISARLAHATRPDDLVARLGGDEFAVILTSTSSDQASAVGRRVVRALEAPVELLTGTVHVGASVGVATASGEGSADQLVHRADVAMYAAKAHGKGRVQTFEDGLLVADSGMQLARDRQRASDVGSREAVAAQASALTPDSGIPG
jgi:diguanylate cyclase (GGDEF)-like protein